VPLKKQKQYQNNPPKIKNKTHRRHQEKIKNHKKKTQKGCAACGGALPAPRSFLRCFFWVFVFFLVSPVCFVLFLGGFCFCVVFVFLVGHSPCLYEPPWGVP